MLPEKPQHFPVGEEEKGYEAAELKAVLRDELCFHLRCELHGSGRVCPSLTSGASAASSQTSCVYLTSFTGKSECCCRELRGMSSGRTPAALREGMHPTG